MPNAYQPCLRCGKGDVPTGFVLEGHRGFVQGGLVELAGIPEDDAADYLVHYEDDERIGLRVRLCRPCSRETGAQVGTLGMSQVPHYKPEGWDE